MTTNATQPVKTAEDNTKGPITPSAKVAPSTSTAPSKPPVVSAPVVATPPIATTVVKEDFAGEKLSFNREKFEGVKLVRMYLLHAGTIQYDPANTELVLDTCDKRGKILPLTPFFKQRIGITLEIVF